MTAHRKENSYQFTDQYLTLEEVRKYIDCYYHKPLSISSLASLTGLSSKYFGEAFKKANGENVVQYITKLRIGRVKQLLRTSNLSIREIAEEVGYSDEFYLSRKFKKEVGISPSIYSRKANLKVAVVKPSVVGNLLALNILPVAAPIDAKWSPYYYQNHKTDIPVHLDPIDINDDHTIYQQLLPAKPDILFIEEKFSKSLEHQLERTGMQIKQLTSSCWKEQLFEMADLLQRKENYEHWVHQYEKRVQQTQPIVSEVVRNDTFVVLRLSGNEMFYYTNRGIRDVLFYDLKLRTVWDQEILWNKLITVKQLVEINPDRLLLLICPDTNTRLFWLSLQYQLEWQQLKAVKNGFAYQIPSNPWFEYSAMGVNRILEEITLLLTGKNPNPALDFVHGVAKEIPL